MRSFDLLVAAFALLQLVRYARGALLFLVPTVRVSGEPSGAPPPSAGRLRAGQQLEALGFRRLGVLRQRGPLGALAVAAETYAGPDGTAYADVSDGRAGPRVVFFTPFAGGGAVVTENVRRRPIATAAIQAAGLPDAPLPAVHAAHAVAVRRFGQRHGPPSAAPELAARVAAARAWYDGPGRRELRTGHAVAFGIALLAAAILASAVNVALRRAT